MVIGVYGIQRSGKSTLISYIMEYCNAFNYKAEYIKLSKTIDEFDDLYVFKKSFSYDKAKCLISKIHSRLKKIESECDYLFVDCHFAFYNGERKNFISVFPDILHCIFDRIFYLDTTSDVILDRMKKTNGVKDNYNYSEAMIEKWKSFEIDELFRVFDHEKVKIVGRKKEPFYECINDLQMKKNNNSIYLCFHKKTNCNTAERIKSRLKCIGENIFIRTDFDSNKRKKELLNSTGEYSLYIHYGLDYEYHEYPYFDFFIESEDDITKKFIERIFSYFELKNEKVLLYLGKFPAKSSDIDGGSQLANQLINSLKHRCCLDISFIRKEYETYFDYDVNMVRYVEYVNPTDNKFKRRFDNFNTNINAIKHENDYDVIIAGHCSKLFGLESDSEIMKKSVIFPMMMTSGYNRSGETVPYQYTKQEELVMQRVNKIITPCQEEKNDILNDYSDVSSDKIYVISRGISPDIEYSVHNLKKDSLNLVYIGSFKKQKNPIDVLRILYELKKSLYDVKVELTMVGAVHDFKVFDDVQNYIRDNELSENVVIKSGITQKQLSEILMNSDIGVSCSSWETFGRGIFECFAAGIPVVMTDRLSVVKDYAKGCEGAYFCKNNEEMQECIEKLFRDREFYSSAVAELKSIAEKVSYIREREILLHEILYKGKNNIFTLLSWEKNDISDYPISEKNGYTRLYYKKYDDAKSQFCYMRKAFADGNSKQKPIAVYYDYINNFWFVQSITEVL